MKAAIATVALFAFAQPAVVKSQHTGVLVGVHRVVDYEMHRGADRQPPAGGELRTLWIAADDYGPAQPVEVPDLLLPRRGGFWRLGLLGTCSEEPHLDGDGKPEGTEADFGDRLWAVPVGDRPTVTVQTKDEVGVAVRVGRCISSDVYCGVDERTGIDWIWPEFVSIDEGVDSGCGAHPDASFGYTVQRPTDLGTALTIGDALGAAVEQRFRRAFVRAATQAADCGEKPQFQPSSWHIRREPGGWKAQGWSDTHRLCGYGVDFTVDVDLSRITGRTDQRARWVALHRNMPELTDAHFSPDARWILATTKRELRFFDAAAPRTVVSVPLRDDESVVMVEWATGSNVDRWSVDVQRVRAEGAVEPVVIRSAGSLDDPAAGEEAPILAERLDAAHRLQPAAKHRH